MKSLHKHAATAATQALHGENQGTSPWNSSSEKTAEDRLSTPTAAQHSSTSPRFSNLSPGSGTNTLSFPPVVKFQPNVTRASDTLVPVMTTLVESRLTTPNRLPQVRRNSLDLVKENPQW
eukprot:2901093-Rhodomonas_salina.2